MKVKGKRTLKNGAIAGYVYYPKDKKWKWRIIGGGKNVNKGRTTSLSKKEKKRQKTALKKLFLSAKRSDIVSEKISLKSM